MYVSIIATFICHLVVSVVAIITVVVLLGFIIYCYSGTKYMHIW